MARAATEAQTLQELAGLLRQLRRREARQQGETQLTYRDLAAKTGWSRGIIGEYFSGNILPPPERFDALIRLLGATPPSRGAGHRAGPGRGATSSPEPEHASTGRAAARPGPAVDGRYDVGPIPGAPTTAPALPGFVGRAAELAQLDAECAGPGMPGTATRRRSRS
ncbi:helix-turn-helix transcriptional regulator [Micromonospora sp. M12]